MVQIDIPVAFGTGSVFAAAVEQGLRSGRASYFYQRALAANVIFQVFVVAWLPVYLLVAHFGFQTSHMWWTGDTIAEHPVLLPVFLVLYFAANVAGFHVGARLAAAGRTKVIWSLFAGGFLFFAAWVIAQPYRTLTLGTYREWEAGTAPWIWSDGGFVALLAGAAALYSVVLAWLLSALRREATRDTSDPTAAPLPSSTAAGRPS